MKLQVSSNLVHTSCTMCTIHILYCTYICMYHTLIQYNLLSKYLEEHTKSLLIGDTIRTGWLCVCTYST